MTTAEVLRAARTLIEDPNRWTQGAEARSQTGRPVDSMSSSAVRFSASAAILRCGGPMLMSDALRILRTCTDYLDVPAFNDTHGHTDVLAAFDRAAAIAEQPLLVLIERATKAGEKR